MDTNTATEASAGAANISTAAFSKPIDDLLDEAKTLYKQGRYLLAYFKVRDAEKLINLLTDVEAKSFVFDKFRANTHTRKIIRSGEAAILFLENMQNKSRWRPYSYSPPNSHTAEPTSTASNNHRPNSKQHDALDITISTHVEEEEGQGKYYLKVEGMLNDVDMLFIMAAFTEVDLYHTWMPFCAQSQIIGEATPYKRITKCLVDFLLFKREALILRWARLLVNLLATNHYCCLQLGR
jgi:hypothetical protein